MTMTGHSLTRTTAESVQGDLGRRIAARRAQLRLTRREAAIRAGMATSYLRYLEEHPGAVPGTGALMKLAGALETTVNELTGGAVDLPPGPGRGSRSATFMELGSEECWALMGTHGVGRIAVPTGSGPVIVPVNYSVVDRAIVYRTVHGAIPDPADGCRVGFEVDRIDDAFSQGWSVLVRGDAHTVTDPRERHRLTKRAYSVPWADGTRDLWVRIAPDSVTGRRITVAGSPPEPAPERA